MRRIGIAAVLALGFVLAPLAAGAQAGKLYRIGALSDGPNPASAPMADAMRELGWVAGHGHHDPQFTETRQRLDGLESAPAEHWWHDVVLDVRKASTPPPPPAKSPSKRRAKGKRKGARRSSA
jgi:hypothetical protein